MLHLEFIYDVKRCDKYIERMSLEIAPFETKTKDNFEWRKTLKVDAQVDAFDKSSWNKSTILDIQEQYVAPGRSVPMATVAFRTYSEYGSKNDEKGRKYDGWSSKFDEVVSIYSPRIAPYLSRT